VTLRKTARAVFEKCHPINWRLDGVVIRSPEVEVDGKLYHVEVTPDRWFPLVSLCPGGTFRCYNPWGWPTVLTGQRATIRRLLGKRLLGKGEPPR